MTGQDLKNSILQLAIQGKLVEQREEEGTAEELYQQIQEERKRRVKEGTIKKQKSLPEISEDEIPFEIPESWKWVRLGELCNRITKGTTPSGGRAAYLDEGIGFLRAENLAGFDKLNLDRLKYIEADTHYGVLKGSILEKDDILISIAGTLGRTALVREDDLPLNANQAVSIVRLADSSTLHLGYLIHAMNAPPVRFALVEKRKITAIPNLTLEIIGDCVIPLPPLEEQKRIVAKIDELLPYVDQYDKVHSEVEELNSRFPCDMEKAILQYAIQGKLVEQREEKGTAEELYQQIQDEKKWLIREGKIKKQKELPEITEDEIPFEIPESWKWVRLGDIGFTNIGLTYRPANVCSEGTVVLRSSNIREGQLVYDDIVRVDMDIPENKMCRAGDILICARNGSKRLVGKAAIIDRDGMSFGAFMAIYRSVCNEFVLYVINSTYFRNALLSETATTTINQITQSMLMDFVLPLPPLEEQKRIVAKIDELLPYVDQYDKVHWEVGELNSRFPSDMEKSILQYAIQGKLVEQREEEGTAVNLIEKIQAEKEQWVKEGRIKREKSLPIIADDETPFVIPETWEWIRFGDLGSYRKGPFGSALTKAMFVPKGNDTVKVYEQKNAIQKDATLGDYYIPRQYFESKMKGFELFPGDIIVSCAGTIGETYVMPEQFQQGIINQALMRMKIVTQMCVDFFLIYFDFILKKTARLSSKGSAIKNIPPFAELKSYLVPLPPLEEQKRIVARSEELMHYVDQYDRVHSEVKELNSRFPSDMEKSILQYAIQGKLVEQREEEGTAEKLYQQIQEERQRLIKEGAIKKQKELPEITEDEIPFEIPESWKWVRLGEITYNWGQKKPDRLFDYIDVGSVDNIKGSLNAKENLIEPSEAPSRARRIVRKGSVLYSTVRPYLLNICIVDRDFRYEPIASTAFAVLHPFCGVDKDYLYLTLRSPMFISYVSSVMVGVAYPAINDTNLLAGLIPLPSLEEQKRIVAKIEELMELVNRLKTSA